MEKETPIFADGLMFKEPREGAPSFVKGSLSVKVDKFIAFLKEHQNEKGWVTLDMKESKNLTTYFQLNTWKPKLQKPESLKTDDEIAEGDLPF